MDWTTTFAEMESYLSDKKIQEDIAEFLAVTRNLIDTSGQRVHCPEDTYAVIEERALIRNIRKKGGGYFSVKCALKTNSMESGEGSTLAKVKIIYSLAGEYMDDYVLSRYS